MKRNISKLFYKDYYADIDFNYALNDDSEGGASNVQTIKRHNDLIKSSDLEVISAPKCCTHFIDFKIQYPGLVTGTGLVHDSKKIDGAFNLGMHFDYTYGMPIVYGSSVKGVLRQYFKEFYEGDIDKEDLFKDIFDGVERDPANDKKDENGIQKKAYRNKSIYNRDIFFDAVITRAYKDDRGRMHLLEDDSITPHGDNPLKDPKPITMLKIAPGCTIQFRFLLRKSIVNGKAYTADMKRNCFKEILETIGVGAKTNVGYGQLNIINN